MAKRPWTELDISRLDQEWRAGTAAADIADRLGRTLTAVQQRASLLGLRRRQQADVHHWTDEELATVRKGWDGGLGTRAIAEGPGLTRNQVEGAVQRLGLMRRQRSPHNSRYMAPEDTATAPREPSRQADRLMPAVAAHTGCLWVTMAGGRVSYCGAETPRNRWWCAEHERLALRPRTDGDDVQEKSACDDAGI